MDIRVAEQDRADVRCVLAGNVEAFEGIVQRWQGPLVNLAYRFCRDRGRSEEMAQDAFLKAFRSLDRWRDEAAFSTWLFAVATNVYRSHVRRVRPLEVPFGPADEPRDPGNPSDEAETNETAETVRNTVARLPRKYRDALLLVYFHDMDVREAATSLALPEGTLKARLHRGRKLLLARLSDTLRSPKSAEAT